MGSIAEEGVEDTHWDEATHFDDELSDGNDKHN